MAPPSPRWLRLGAVLLGLALLPAAEGLLRLTGAVRGAEPSLPDGAWSASDRGEVFLVEQDGVVRPAPALVADGFMQDLQFPARPTPGVPRIVCFGGSATLGVPVERAPERTFPGRLQARLASAGFETEVINLGGASFGSDQVRALAEAVLPYDPDALVIYSGNNEYFNFNLRLYEANRQWYAERLEGLHLMRALRLLLGRDPTPDAARATQDAVVAAAIAGRLEAEDAWPRVEGGLGRRTDSIHAAVLDRYRDNLSAVAALTAETATPVLIARVPANLAEPPWLALADPGEDDSAAQAALAGDCDAAEAAIADTPGHAGGWYRRGMCGMRSGAPVAEWGGDLTTALSLDLSPGRPPPDLQAIPAQVAERWPHVRHLSLDALFSAQSDPPYGLNLCHDSCHLTPDGYDRLAAQIAVDLVSLL
jgi:lysophospholipase L1-like esterase